MINLSTCLTILSVAEQGIKLFDWFSGARLGEGADQALAARRRDDPNLIKVSDRIFIDNSIQEVRSENSGSRLSDVRQIRDLVEPVADAIGGSVLTSQILETPPRLKAAFDADPWLVLDNIRPFVRATADPRPDWVPIAFFENGVEYVGWQKRGALPQLFDCEFDALGAESAPLGPWAREVGTTPSNPVPLTPSAIWTPAKVKNCLEHAFWPVTSSGAIYFAPDIPEMKLRNALSLNPMPRNERVIALFDSTVFGSAKRAMLFCLFGIHFRNDTGTQPIQGSISYLDFCASEIKAFNTYHVEFGPCHIFDIAGSGLSVDQVIVVLTSLQAELREALAKE